MELDRDWVTTTLKQANSLKAIQDLEWELTIQTDSIAAFYEEQLIYDPKPTTYDGAKLIYGIETLTYLCIDWRWIRSGESMPACLRVDSGRVCWSKVTV